LKEAGFTFDESKDLVAQLDDALLVLDKESLKILNESSSGSMSNVGVGPKNRTQNIQNGTEQSNLLRAFVL
jgi:hypothetical protein